MKKSYVLATVSELSTSLGCFCPRTSFSKGLGMLPWISVVPDLHTKLRIINKSVSGLANDFPSSVWGRGGTTCLLDCGLHLGWCFFKWHLVRQFSKVERIFLQILPLLKGVRPVLEGCLLSQCTKVRANRKSQSLARKDSVLDVLFAHAGVLCDKKTWQTGVNHD